MADKRVIFIAFAMEDEGIRNLFTGQSLNTRTPYEFVDMSVKEPYKTAWKDRVRTRIRRSHGVIALISSDTPQATGQLWEISCAADEGKPLLGVWIDPKYRTKPVELGTAPCTEWTWPAITAFVEDV
ncbi:TIR domain-containing protein [Kribbella speibonae]|uniref:Thoeris protein ThsB TIR-like domain-containing protein n=1 Tax=Kribbella speibonae TaxID=1572660 RepID=A0A4R0IRC6_9ACTN|nr:TIR domain-containing protein [Kribbella speibonae]TCC36331.1 hypothetical protein E0H92_27155 [Kribbella speibonae]